MTVEYKQTSMAILIGLLGLWSAGLTAAMVTTADGTEVPDIGPLPPVEANPDNVPTDARLALGRALFFDNRISASGTMNCATCHLPHQGWTVNTPLSPANPGWVERRNSPSLINVGYNKALIWDGRAWPLEKQAIGSTKNPIHKGQDIDRLMAMFNEDAEMVRMFRKAYGSAPNAQDYGKALAVFQRHFIVTGPSPFDRYAAGDTSAIDRAAVRGLALFKGEGNCIACHNGPNFTDSGFHNVGLKHNPVLDSEAHQKVLKFDAKRTKNTDWKNITTDPGRYLITHEARDWSRFKTPTLRNLADTRPYMHDGRYWTLDEVIDHYDRGGDNTRNQDPRIKPLKLNAQEKQDLKAFLAALRGPLPPIRMEDWVRPITKAAELDGKALFEGKATCVNCHQADGQGVPGVFPPLASNPRVREGDGSYVAKTIIYGRSGEIRVHGKAFNATMPPVGIQQELSDAEIAAVASYVRSAWGNQASEVTKKIVTRQR